MLAWHLGWRYLCRRRAAWLAIAAITLTVAVPVVVIGVVQGFYDVTVRQTRANEADLTVTSSWFGDGVPLTSRGQLEHPAVVRVAPFVSFFALMVPRTGHNDSNQGLPAQVDAVDFAADQALGRLAAATLHPAPVTDLSSPPVSPDRRGSGFLTRNWRDHVALEGLALAGGLGVGALPLPPMAKPPPGLIAGRELLYGSGIGLGMTVQLAAATGAKVNAEISDTVGTGILEVDRFAAVVPLEVGQTLAGYQAKPTRPAQVGGWRVQTKGDVDLDRTAWELRDRSNLRVDTWMDRRGNLLLSLKLQRNIMALVMVAIQTIAVFIVYAVFSTLVAEKRHDIGVLLGLGAKRRDIAGAFLWAGLVACLLGGVAGWALGWGVLAALNPLSRYFKTPLFPQDVIYTPEAPTSFDPLIPLFFIGIMAVVGVIAVALPAWRASRIVPVDILREGA